jgi:hypothetical protein
VNVSYPKEALSKRQGTHFGKDFLIIILEFILGVFLIVLLVFTKNRILLLINRGGLSLGFYFSPLRGLGIL